MRYFKFGLAILMAVILASCGGGGSDVPAKPRFSSQVSFGDSLSDVGSYKVGLVAALGGGQFTINGAAGTPTNWTEFIAEKLGLPAPCAAMTGLDDGTGTPSSTNVAITNYPACTGYGQGGARVTNPIGSGNKAAPVGAGFALTVPVVDQIAEHLARLATPSTAGKFNGDEIVFVMAGANDVFYQAGLIGAGLPAASGVAAVQTAASELAAAVNTQIVDKGAKHVVVVNLPDMGSTPYATAAGAKSLFDNLVSAFNTQLKTSLPDSANVLNVDAFTASHDEIINKDKYNLTNVTGIACNLTSPSPNPLGSVLACNAGNVTGGSLTAVDHYMFADGVHPTPYAHSLFALYVLQAMTNKGWY